jgi:hypothetical protein
MVVVRPVKSGVLNVLKNALEEIGYEKCDWIFR